jgi:WhiB family redox-sensing transcriptional regulator
VLDALLAAKLADYLVAFERANPWRADALCREPAYADLPWIPTRGEPIEEARAVCGRCLVQRECREYALALDEPLLGVWGGTSHRDRLARGSAA